MNLAILSYEYPPDTGFGGIGTYSYYHARALVKLGHRVHVIAGSTKKGIHRSEHDGVHVTRIQRSGWLARQMGGLKQRGCGWFASRMQTAAAAYEVLARLLRREAIDAVEMPECGGDGILVTTMLDVPSVIKYHSPARLIMGIYDTSRRDRDLTAFTEQIAMNQATVHTSCSKFVADAVAARLRVRAPIRVIPNGIDVALFDRDERIDPHKRFGVPRRAPTVFLANRMEERKGLHIVERVAPEILRRHKDAHFVLAGSDTYGYLQSRVLPAMRAQRLHKRFHWLGALDLPSVRAIMKRIDVFLLASVWENCPYSCIEAMTARRAVVSSDCAGMPELITDRENGLLARNGDAASFVRALDEALADRALRERLGAAARATVEARLTDVAIAERAVDAYRAAASARIA